MAQRLPHTVSPPPFPGAHEELDALLETLHRAGTLRAFNGFFGRLAAVTEIGLDELQTPAGHSLLGALGALGEVIVQLPADQLHRVAQGLKAGLQQAHDVVLDEKAPSLVHLLHLLREPETRRAVGMILTVLHAVGSALHAPRPAAD